MLAQSHHDDIAEEVPLLIDPTTENPEEFIEYRADVPRAIEGNIKARLTIKRTGLDRPFLDEDRLQHYRQLKLMYQTLHSESVLPETLRTQFQQHLDHAQQNDAEYASMIRWAVKLNFAINCNPA